MHPSREEPGRATSVTIGFPVTCEYRGGNSALGRHGRHFRIEGGALGHGELTLTHHIPLDTVASVELAERQFGGTDAQTLMAMGVPPLITKSASPPLQITDITVRTEDGQEALWVVERRGAEWVRAKLAPVLSAAGIPFYDDLPPSQR